MKKQIELEKTKVEYSLKQKRGIRRMRLTIHQNGAFVVSAPMAMSLWRIESFINQKARWIISKLQHFQKIRTQAHKLGIVGGYSDHKNKAQQIALNKVAQFNQIYNFPVNKIIIKNHKTLWGSCSKKGNLNFNYKIALLPERHIDYIIVHELCHLKEFNHSQNFWNLVEKTIPEHKIIRKELKTSGLNFI